MTAAATRAANAIAAQGIIGFPKNSVSERAALEDAAACIEVELRPLIDAVRAALSVEVQIRDGDTTRGRHQKLIDHLEAVLRHAEGRQR